MSKSDVYFIGVDVGTGSVRAALVNDSGKILNVSTSVIKIWNPQADYYEQSSDDIWKTCCNTIKKVCQNVEREKIKGIGFDATCSLVVLDNSGAPLSVSRTGNNEQNIIMWMDHRAEREASKINKVESPVLRYVGGKISLEMEMPKLLWLKTHMWNECWDKAGLFFDLPDFLTWKATKSDSRSLCSLVCKWSYEISEGKGAWNENFLKEIGLEDLMVDDFKKIGNTVLCPGTPCGYGLCEEAAEQMDLPRGTAVSVSIIDAHAGGLAMLGVQADNIAPDFNSRLGLICGTSTCHMAVSLGPVFAEGVWGPYWSAMVPGMWLNEGGQSATGKLLDHIIESHPAYRDICVTLGDKHIHAYLNELLVRVSEKLTLPVERLTSELHVWPDFHGNRSPLADPTLKGMISGLTLSTSEENLAVLYLATIQALAYGTRQILETLKSSGYEKISSVVMCGGLSKNPVFVQTQADILGLPVLCPNETESVLLGSAILGACAAGLFCNMNEAIHSMAGRAGLVTPDEDTRNYHDNKYKVFLKMVQDQKEYANIMRM